MHLLLPNWVTVIQRFLRVPKSLIDRLHYVQNSAGYMITRATKYDHFTPVLKLQHGLLLSHTILYELLL